MFVIMGASGHVGSAVASVLIERGQAVTLITHDPNHAPALQDRGAEVAVASTDDVDALRAAFTRGKRAFLLNPPADVKTDTNAVELKSVANIVAALEGSGLEKVVLESTAGAMPGDGIGDLSVLYDFERRLREQSIPAAFNRAAFYMSNWDPQLGSVRGGAPLETMYPPDFKLPMVAPRDLGLAAADRLMTPIDDIGVKTIEGPKRYSSNDVAQVFGAVLKQTVTVKTTPPGKLRAAYQALGFSAAAAEAYSRMTEESLKSDFDFDGVTVRGSTTLADYVASVALLQHESSES